MEPRLTKSILFALGIIAVSLQDVSAYPGKKPEGGLITQCQYPGTKGLYISTKKYTYENATTTCQKLGGSLVDLTNQNILLASDILLTCVGPNSKAWVGSWDYKEDFEAADGVNDCVSLVVSNIGPSGTISKVCKGSRYVICQNHDSPVEHNPLYSQPAWSSVSYSSLPTLDPGLIEMEDEDDDDDDFGKHPVYYPQQVAGAYSPPRPAAYYPDHDDDMRRPAVKPIYYPRPGNDVYDAPKKTYKPAFYPKPAAAGQRNSHWKQHRYPKVIEPADEDCETWTLNGVVTTITKQPKSATSAAAVAPTAAPAPTKNKVLPALSESSVKTASGDELAQKALESEDSQVPQEQAEQQPAFEENEPDNGPIPNGATKEDILDKDPAQLE